MPATTGIGGSNTLLAWNNYVLTSALAASSQTATLSVNNLQNEVGAPSSAWQTAGATQNVIVTITPQIARSVWRAFGLFRTNLTPFATVTMTLYNNPSLFVWNASVDGPEPGFGQSVLIAATDMQADYCTIEIDDVGNPDGFLNVPLIYAGPAWQPLTGLGYETTFGGDAALDENLSRGGQEYPKFRYDRRRAELAFMGIRQGEVLGQLAELQLTARRGNNILMVPDVSSETIAQEAIFGRVSATADVGFPYQSADRRSWRARITERL